MVFIWESAGAERVLVVFMWEWWWCLCERVVVVVFMWEWCWCLCERMVVMFMWESGGADRALVVFMWVLVVFTWECWWCLCERVVVQRERWCCLCEGAGSVYVRVLVVFIWESAGAERVLVVFMWEWWWCLCERVVVVFMWESGGAERALVVFMWECWWCLSERVLVMLGLCMSVPQLAQVLQVRLLLSDHLPETSRRSDHDLRPAHQNPLLLLRSHPSDHDRCPDPCSTTRLHVIIGSEPEHQMMTGNTANAHDLLSGVLTCLHAQFRFQSDWISSDWWTWM